MKKRSVKTKLLIQLRRLGVLCRKPKPHKYELKISHTIAPEGDTSPLKSARFVFLQNKIATIKGCEFDANKETCKCGVDINQFLGYTDENGNVVGGCLKTRNNEK